MSTESDDAPKRAKRKPTGNYETGYCRPPKNGKFKKGEPSRNPKGRPRRSPTPTNIVEDVSRMTVAQATKSGGAMIAFEAVITKLFHKAMQRDPKARSQVLKLREAFEAQRPTPLEPEWRIRRVTTFHDDVPVDVVESPYNGFPGDPIPPPRKKARTRHRPGNEAYIEIFDRIANTQLTVGAAGKKKRVSAEHAIWLGIFADASQNDSKAMDLIIRYGKHARMPDPELNDERIVYTLNLGDAPIVHTGPTVRFLTEFLE